MDKIKTFLLMKLIELIMGMAKPETIRKFADNLLDFVETYVKGTASTVDDRIVVPLCTMIREVFGIPDKD